MKNLLIVTLVVLASCTKTTTDRMADTLPQSQKQTCTFGLQSYNLTKRPSVITGDELGYKRPRPGGTTTTPPPPPPSPAGAAVILLDFDGHVVSGTPWNYNGDINCAPANLTADAIDQIVQRIANDYSPFNITVTTDAAVFNAATSKRMRIIFTETWEWYGQSGGTALLNTFTAGSNIPCFVFTSLLNYSTKMIAEAGAHEGGHTIGLYHQSSYDANGVKTAEYNAGTGSGETAWAPIMGVGYYRNLTLWHSGPNSNGATSIQDDVAIIAAAAGYKTDDFSNTITGAASLTLSLNGLLNNQGDIDFFAVNTTNAVTVNLTPSNVGISNAGANVDLVLKVYNSSGALIATTNSPDVLQASVTLDAGNYLVSVSTQSNIYTTNYGMMGKYRISIN